MRKLWPWLVSASANDWQLLRLKCTVPCVAIARYISAALFVLGIVPAGYCLLGLPMFLLTSPLIFTYFFFYKQRPAAPLLRDMSAVFFNRDLAYAFAAALLLLPFWWVQSALQRRKEATRNRILYEELRHDSRAPVLVLRSYRHNALERAATSRRAGWSYQPGWWLGMFVVPFVRRPAKYWLVREAVKIASRVGRVVMLGPDASLPTSKGAWFIQTSDRDWIFVFQACACASAAVVVIPETTPSLAAELVALLRSSLRSKILILMPPSFSPEEMVQPWWLTNLRPPKTPEWELRPRLERFARIPKRWAAVQSVWSSAGLRLPYYERGGMIYVPAEDASPVTAWRFGTQRRTAVEATIQTAIETVGKSSCRAAISLLASVLCKGLPGRELELRDEEVLCRQMELFTSAHVGDGVELPRPRSA